jgi:hypothetical protein
MNHQCIEGGFDSWDREAEGYIVTVHAGEKSSWRKVSTHIVEFAEMVKEGIHEAAAVAEVLCVVCGHCRWGSKWRLEIVFGGFCLLRTCNFQI